MVELFISKRVIFPKGKQGNFLFEARKTFNLSYIKLAELLKISSRTLADWRREKFSMSLNALEIILRKTKKKLPKDIEIKPPFWYVNKGAKAGGAIVYAKHGNIGGDPEYRKKRWREWWQKKGRHKKRAIYISSPIKKPKKSKNLAEFVGIILGDGGIARYQVTVSFNSQYEKEYSRFVINLIKKLFDVPVGISYDKNYLSLDLVISRIELVRFCINNLRLKQGNKIKQQVDVPCWIKKNKSYSIACLRGLIDTDGCIFTHRYKVRDKFYNYKKLCFTSYSEPLRQWVFNILRIIGLKPRLAQRRDVRLDNIKDVQKYFQLVGSHNLKHLQRYKK